MCRNYTLWNYPCLSVRFTNCSQVSRIEDTKQRHSVVEEMLRMCRNHQHNHHLQLSHQPFSYFNMIEYLRNRPHVSSRITSGILESVNQVSSRLHSFLILYSEMDLPRWQKANREKERERDSQIQWRGTGKICCSLRLTNNNENEWL
jgi:hypothetical protein